MTDANTSRTSAQDVPQEVMTAILRLEEPLSDLERVVAAMHDMALAMRTNGNDGASPLTIVHFADALRDANERLNQSFRDVRDQAQAHRRPPRPSFRDA